MLVGQIVYIFVYRKTYLKESNTFATLQPFYILFVNGLILLDVTDLRCCVTQSLHIILPLTDRNSLP